VTSALCGTLAGAIAGANSIVDVLSRAAVAGRCSRDGRPCRDCTVNDDQRFFDIVRRRKR